MSTTEDPTLERHFQGHRGEVTCLSFHPQQKQLASAGTDSNLMIWNLSSKARAIRNSGHKDQILDICYSPSGNLIVSASKDKSIRYWETTIQGSAEEFMAHSAAIRSVHFSLDCRTLITASDDKTVKLWSNHTKKFIASFTEHNNWVRCARFSYHDVNVFASCSEDKTTKLYDTRVSLSVHSFHELKGFPTYLSFQPGGSCLANASGKDINIYETRTNKIIQQYESHNKNVNQISFHPNGNILISASEDGTLKIWDLLEGRPLYTLTGHKEGSAIKSVAFSSNGGYFASGGADQRVLVWKTNFDMLDQLKEKQQEDLDTTFISCEQANRAEAGEPKQANHPLEEAIAVLKKQMESQEKRIAEQDKVIADLKETLKQFLEVNKL